MVSCSDEDVDVKGLVGAWLNTQPPQEQQMLSGWLEDYFYKALAFVLKQVGAGHSLMLNKRGKAVGSSQCWIKGKSKVRGDF